MGPPKGFVIFVAVLFNSKLLVTLAKRLIAPPSILNSEVPMTTFYFASIILASIDTETISPGAA